MHSVPDHWVCILMSGGHFYRVCSLLGVRMWALWDPMLFCISLSYLSVREMSDLLLRTPSHCPFHHYVHYWCDFTPCLIWVDHYSSLCYLFIIILVFASDSSFSLHVLFFSYSNPSRVWYSLRVIITHITINSFCFIGLLIDILFTLGILMSMAHGIYYTWCISYMRAWVYDHWVFEPCFISFLSPYYLSLSYVLGLKTTFRP